MGFLECFVLVTGVAGACVWTAYEASLDGRMKWDEASLADILLYTRLVCGAINWSVCAFLIFSKTPLNIQIGKRTIQLLGITRFTTFTVWCWTVMGVYYALATAMSAYRVLAIPDVRAHVHGDAVFPHWLLCVTWVLYELSFSQAILVTLVVTFVLIPVAKKNGINVDNMYKWPPLIMHNLNVVFMFLELFTNGLQFVKYHVVFVALFGCSYAFFAWYWHSRTGIFYYFFLDYNMKMAPFAYLCVLGAVSAFFMAGDFLSVTLKPRVEF